MTQVVMGPLAWRAPFSEGRRAEETVNPSRPIGGSGLRGRLHPRRAALNTLDPDCNVKGQQGLRCGKGHARSSGYGEPAQADRIDSYLNRRSAIFGNFVPSVP